MKLWMKLQWICRENWLGEYRVVRNSLRFGLRRDFLFALTLEDSHSAICHGLEKVSFCCFSSQGFWHLTLLLDVASWASSCQLVEHQLVMLSSTARSNTQEKLETRWEKSCQTFSHFSYKITRCAQWYVVKENDQQKEPRLIPLGIMPIDFKFLCHKNKQKGCQNKRKCHQQSNEQSSEIFSTRIETCKWLGSDPIGTDLYTYFRAQWEALNRDFLILTKFGLALNGKFHAPPKERKKREEKTE